MSNSNRNPTNQPLRPKLASSNSARSPLTPRLGAATRSTQSVRSDPSAPRVKQSNHETPPRDILSNGNITPRSSVRTSKIGSASNTPTQTNTTPSAVSSRPPTAVSGAGSERNGSVAGIGSGAGAGTVQNRARVSRPNSTIGDTGSGGLRLHAPLSPAPVTADGHSQITGAETHFFHANDAIKQEPAPKRPEPKKTPSFFYADGQQEARLSPQIATASPPLSALSEQRSAGPWIRPERGSNPSKSPPMLSPALSSISQTPSFFAAANARDLSQRPPSPSEENIHLSYRKGASQIFGTRPLPTSRSSHEKILSNGKRERQGSLEPMTNITPHRKSPSLSSIDSGNSPPSRRRSGTLAELVATPSPLTQENRTTASPRIVKPVGDLPSIDTSLETPELSSPPPESNLSPTKGVTELAADARRERKVLDLEISNSSLLAINASLEREIRRQKTELKRFRRLSRAGRFSFGSGDRAARLSEGLSAVGEEDEDNEESDFGFPSGLTDAYDDGSDDEEDSLVSSTEPTSPSTTSRTDSDRLAKDEKRLRVDLERHKELLVQSQMMNQSIKRCMYATEDMIQEGKKALDYHVRVSDVKLGGRVLSSHDEEDEYQEIEVHDHDHDDDSGDVTHGNPDMEQAKGIVDLWSGLGRPSYENSDRDSGIEVEKSAAAAATAGAAQALLPLVSKSADTDFGRPPDSKGQDPAVLT